MTPNARNNNTGAGKILNRLAEDKKKSVTALCLIAVMAVMWFRVLARKTPDGAEAAPVTTDGQTVEKPADGSRTADTRARAEEGARTTPQPSKLELQQIAQPGWREAQPPQEILIQD